MSGESKPRPFNRATLMAAAKARGIVPLAGQADRVLDGGQWLRTCVARLRGAGFK